MDIEAITGIFWYEMIRYQHNVGFLPEYTHLSMMNINYLYQPIPVYWREYRSSYNEEGKQDYWDRVSAFCYIVNLASEFCDIVNLDKPKINKPAYHITTKY